MPTINTVHCKLIGLNCLSGQEGDRVRSVWTDRYLSHEAFWVDVKAGQTTADITGEVIHAIREQGIAHLGGATLIVAVFLDLREDVDTAFLSQIIQVPGQLHKMLGCNIPLTLEFGAMGRLNLANAPVLRQRITQAVAVNGGQQAGLNLRQLYLVATPQLVREVDDNSWKAVTVFLDVLRRDHAPAAMLTMAAPNGFVGFLRYGEHDAVKLESLKKERTRLQKLLSDGGGLELSDQIKQTLTKLEMEIEDRYPVDGTLQPIHPHMLVEGWWKKRNAAKGSNKAYEKARNSTWAAMELTAKGLQKTILSDYSPRIQEAGQALARFVEEAQLGIDVESDQKRMLELIRKVDEPVTDASAPLLTYQEEGCTGDITTYLQDVRSSAASKVRHAFIQELERAYCRISPESFQNKRTRLTQELGSVNTLLKNQLDREDFISLCAGGTPLAMSCFYPVLPGGMELRWVLCRTGEDNQSLAAACAGGMTKVLHIDKQYGGLRRIDDAPIKALQVLLFDCTQARLQDLL